MNAVPLNTLHERWFKDTHMQKWLRETLATPEGSIFLDLLRACNVTSLTLPPTENISFSEWQTYLSGTVNGYDMCLRNIIALASENKIDNSTMPEPFSHITTKPKKD